LKVSRKFGRFKPILKKFVQFVQLLRLFAIARVVAKKKSLANLADCADLKKILIAIWSGKKFNRNVREVLSSVENF
jgi:hypothetical protein